MSFGRRSSGEVRSRPLRRAVFWVFFVPYVIGVAAWLIVGLAPSVVHESPTLHRALHERAGDALGAGRDVTIHFDNRDPEESYNVTLMGPNRVLKNPL